MRILALDYGLARCGCAISDPTGSLVRPLKAIEPPAPERLAQVAEEEGAELIVVGLPVSLDGGEGQQARTTREFCARLAEATSIPIETHDERFTTVLAGQSARSGATGDPDSLAAAHLLESYLAAADRQPRESAGG